NGGTNTVVVSVYDPSQTGGQAVGKQRINDVKPHPGGGIFYTAASGIWQTVWLEPVAAAHITRLDMTPNLGNSTLRVRVQTAGAAGRSARITVSSGGTVVGSATGPVGGEISVPVPNPRLWSPEDPFLYDVRADLLDGSAVTDTVGSYTGMRSVGLAKVDNILRPVLNGKFVFQTGTL
ncbi:glycoside hydrolase family 2, partial [Streptomyces sp. SID8455]|nr:glycoside hydrolase family 2 [Streptomyces sp. SID8455]